MTTSVVLLHYNNYFNRQVKILSTLTEYTQEDADSVTCNNINFIPGDGINTSLVLGKGTNPGAIFTGAKDKFDYLVVFDSSEQDNPILSRWFIIETHRTREGQYDIRLRRDVIADNYEDILNSPMYIEKGYISDTNNPLLYNNESLSVNQIKVRELPIQDKTKCGWVVGYISRDAEPGTVKSSAVFSQGADITVANLSEWTYWDYCDYNVNYKSVAQVRAKKEINFHLSSMYQNNAAYFWGRKRVNSYVGKDENGWTLKTDPNGETTGTTTEPTWWTEFSGLRWKSSSEQTGKTSGNSYFGISNCNWLCQNLYSATYNNNTLNSCLNTVLADKYNVEFNDSKFDTLSTLNGKILYDSTNRLYYRVAVKSRSTSSKYNITDEDTGGTTLREFLNNNIVKTGFPEPGELSGSLVSGDIDGVRLAESSRYLTLEQVVIEVQAEIPNSTGRVHLEDSPYDMFCIPYSDDLQMTDGTDTWTCNKAVAVSIATDIGAKSGSDNIYDIQVLPYCPSEQLVQASADPSVLANITSVPHTIVETTETTPRKITAIIWCPRSTFSFEVNETTIASTFGAPYTIETSALAIKRNDYYMAPTFPEMPSSTTISLISYTGGTTSRGIELYKVDKSTGEATLMTSIKKVELTNDGTTQTIKLSKSSWPTPSTYISHTREEYNALPYCYMIKRVGDGIVIQQNAEFFKSMFKKPTINDFGTDLSTPEKVKISNDCYLYRLSAGNYSALFEFSLAKSQGYDGYIVDCTYKPFAPWIHIIPKLKGLYGEDFTEIDDARGLICGGDYSLPQITNAWANYQLNNKTYQDVFDRQMKNMDVNNDIARQEQLVQSVTGGITGAAAGATAGAMSGGGVYGAIAGGIVGGLSGIAGGVMDYQNLITRQEEAKSYATDMYNYSLQNIQAIPSGLAKTSALVANTRIWPFLEIFTCTDREKEAYLDKLEYDGMTIMAIGKIADFKTEAPHYFKGEIIRLPSLKEDAHMANEICMELKKGVYI